MKITCVTDAMHNNSITRLQTIAARLGEPYAKFKFIKSDKCCKLDLHTVLRLYRIVDPDVRFMDNFRVTGRLLRRASVFAADSPFASASKRLRIDGDLRPRPCQCTTFNTFKSDLEVAEPHVRFVLSDIGPGFRGTRALQTHTELRPPALPNDIVRVHMQSLLLYGYHASPNPVHSNIAAAHPCAVQRLRDLTVTLRTRRTCANLATRERVRMHGADWCPVR